MKQRLSSGLAILILSACTRLEPPDLSQLAGTGPILAPSSGGIQLIDLGTLPGGWPSFATGVNASGVVVGYSYTGVNYSGVQHAVRWNQSAGAWTLTDLAPQLTGSTWSAAVAINSGGDVTGWLRTSSGADHAFLLTAGGAFVDLGTPPGMNASYAQGINAGGAVVGYSQQSDPTGQSRRAFYFSAGVMVVLPTLGQTSEASAIADNGTIVGHSYDGSGTEYAVRWTQDAGGTWSIAALPGGANATATAINGSGNIVGGGCTNLTASGCADTRAYFWPAADQPPTILGTLGGGHVSFAQAVNDAGQLVGWSFTKIGAQHGFYSASATSALLDLGALGGKAAPSNATSLNGSKLVVGSSRVDTRPAQSTAGTHATAWILP